MSQQEQKPPYRPVAEQPHEPVSCPRYARNRTGEVVHRLDCKRRGRTSAEWTYAEGMSAAWVMEQIARIPWLHACHYCLPQSAVTLRISLRAAEPHEKPVGPSAPSTETPDA